MSDWGDILRVYHAPIIMDQFGGDLVTIRATRNDEILASSVPAVLGDIETYEVESQGMMQKREGRWIDVLKDSTEGLRDNFVRAYIVTESNESWDIVRVERETEAMFRLTCLRAENHQVLGNNIYPQ